MLPVRLKRKYFGKQNSEIVGAFRIDAFLLKVSLKVLFATLLTVETNGLIVRVCFHHAFPIRGGPVALGDL